MAALIVAISVMAILMTAVMPVWKQSAQREKEAELVFRGQQYVHAIQLFQRKSGPGTYPPSIDFLVQQKFLRKKYKDPITNGDFVPVPPVAPVTQGATGVVPGTTPAQSNATNARNAAASSFSQLGASVGGVVPGGVAGVVSKSTDTSIRIYNGQTHYNEWVFRALPQPPAGAVGGPGGPQRGGPGRQGPGGPGGGIGGGPQGGGPQRGGPQRGGPGGRFGGPGGGNGFPPLPPGARGLVTLPDGRVIQAPPPGR